MSQELMIAIITIGLPTLLAGIWRLRQDARKERDKAITAAYDRAYEKARLEAVAREAEAAVTAKNAELDAVKSQLADCLASKGGG